MKKKNTKTKKTTVNRPKKTRVKNRVATKKKTGLPVGKKASIISGAKTASLKRTIRKIKTGLKQLEKVVGK
jgi:hypothetical protein